MVARAPHRAREAASLRGLACADQVIEFIDRYGIPSVDDDAAEVPE